MRECFLISFDKALECGEPLNPPPHGTLEYTNTSFQSIANYSCQPGYKMTVEAGYVELQCIPQAGIIQFGMWGPFLWGVECHGKKTTQQYN